MSGKVDRGPVTRFKYGSVVRRGGVLEETGDVWVCEGRVVDPQRLFYEERRSADVVVDCRRLIVAPGFIDLQINGEPAFRCQRETRTWLALVSRASPTRLAPAPVWSDGTARASLRIYGTVIGYIVHGNGSEWTHLTRVHVWVTTHVRLLLAHLHGPK